MVARCVVYRIWGRTDHVNPFSFSGGDETSGPIASRVILGWRVGDKIDRAILSVVSVIPQRSSLVGARDARKVRGHDEHIHIAGRRLLVAGHTPEHARMRDGERDAIEDVAHMGDNRCAGVSRWVRHGFVERYWSANVTTA